MQYVNEAGQPRVTILIFAVLRAVLLVLGTVGWWHGSLSDDQLMIVSGGLASLASLAWSIYEKFTAARHIHAALMTPVPPSAPEHKE